MTICVHCQDYKVQRCDETGCDRVHLGQPYTPDQCRPCWLRLENVKGPISWAYGVTTIIARAANGTLASTLLSLATGGFPVPHLFVDGSSSGTAFNSFFLKTNDDLPVTLHGQRVCTAGNWILSLYELYILNPMADRYAIFQDDIEVVKGLRQYLESKLYPARGYLNLLTFMDNEPVAALPRGFHPSNQRGQGAVALVFNREAVQSLLQSRHMVMRPVPNPADPGRSQRAIDGGIVEAMRQMGYVEYVHSPSLVQHVGLVSSMGNKQHPQARSFPGASFDATRWSRPINLLECVHRGPEKRRELCPSCQGHVEVKILSCHLFSECTIVKPLPSVVHVCQTCQHREPG